MAERAIVIFPEFEHIQTIENIRKKYDPLAKLISPHITLVFPFQSEDTKEDINLKLQAALAGQHLFNIELSGISKQIDSFGNYLFLNVTQGHDEIKTLHKALYKALFHEDKTCEIYIPHITIGKFHSLDMLEAAHKNVIGIVEKFKAVVHTVSVEVIEKNGDAVSKIAHETAYDLK